MAAEISQEDIQALCDNCEDYSWAEPDDDDIWITEGLDLVFGLMLGVDFQEGSEQKAIENGIGKSSSQACDESIEFIQLMIETIREIPFGPPEPDCWTEETLVALWMRVAAGVYWAADQVCGCIKYVCCQLVA